MITINRTPYEIKFFPDGTLNMTNTFIQHRREFPCVYLEWKFENLIEQVVLQNLVMFIKDELGADVSLVLPYVPNARMDRVKNPEHEVHTLKYFIEWLNWLGFREVITTDVHSPVTMTLLHHGRERNIRLEIDQVLTYIRPSFFFFPDEGAFKRYEYLSTEKLRPFYGKKNRDWATGKIVGYEVCNPLNLTPTEYKNSSILIVDDISSYGGTFNFAANALIAYGFSKIYLYVTHCENSILEGEAIDNPFIKRIFTTDSIFTGEHPKITVI